MSVKKMDEVPEKKTESKILAKMGKKEQGRCQKESVVLKNGQSTDNGKHVTVRVQRIRKIHIKQKLIIFSVLAVCLVVLAVFSDHLCPYDPYAQDLSSALQAPSLQHPMGTDTYGRDMLSRVISGARASIFSTFILVAVISIFGTIVGLCCGYYGGILDSVMMRISDVCLAFPGLVFAMAIAAILGGGIQNAIIALAVVSWPKYSRIARSQTLALKEEPYIHAAILAGDSSAQILVRHVLPNMIGPVLVTAIHGWFCRRELRFLYRWLFLICWEIPSGITWIRRIAGSSDARQSEAEIRGFQNTILDSFVLSKRK